MSAHEDQVRALARYNQQFNQRLFQQLAGLSDEERRRDVGAFFGSIHATLNHILLADRIWLARFAAAFPSMTSLHEAELVQGFTSLGDELFADFDALDSARRATDQIIVDWTDQLTDELLAATMRYSNTRGDAREHPAWVAVAHLFNHQTHHRGQITTAMHQLGHDPGVTDFLAYVT